MHIVITVFIVFLIWYKGVWKDWRQYHSTMLFFGFMELEYNLIVGTNDYFLWKLIPDMHMTRVPLISLYVFVIFPGTALLFLSKFPKRLSKQILHIFIWVAVYSIVEWIGLLVNRITYFNGWNIWHSIIFNIILFWGLSFHHRRPFTAYVIFIIVTVLGIWGYKIPI